MYVKSLLFNKGTTAWSNRKHFPSLSKREVILAFTIKERMPSQAEKVTLKLTINTVHNIPNAEFSNQISSPPSLDGNTTSSKLGWQHCTEAGGLWLPYPAFISFHFHCCCHTSAHVHTSYLSRAHIIQSCGTISDLAQNSYILVRKTCDVVEYCTIWK